MERNGVLAAIFDRSTNSLKTIDQAGAGSTAPLSRRDENGAWAEAYDETTQRLKVVQV